MKLSEKQRLFTRLQAELVQWAFENGYELTDGDAYRDPRAFGPLGTRRAYGRSNSNHKRRLARDYNLFVNGDYKRGSEDYRPLGEKWKSMHPLARWGGDFRRADGNHFSFEHGGNA